MRRIALALTAAFTVALGVAPAAGKTPPNSTTYDVTSAQGQVRISFHGDEAAGCRDRGLCSLSGTTTYAFGGTPRFGRVHWVRQRKRTLLFYGFFETKGTTVSDVVSAGNPEHCVDRSTSQTESAFFEPRSRRIRFQWRQAVEPGREGFFIGSGSDVFDTRCAGPALADLAPSRALPFADVPYRVFRSPRSSFRTTGSRPFAGGGFAGTVDWDLTYGFRYRR